MIATRIHGFAEWNTNRVRPAQTGPKLRSKTAICFDGRGSCRYPYHHPRSAYAVRQGDKVDGGAHRYATRSAERPRAPPPGAMPPPQPARAGHSWRSLLAQFHAVRFLAIQQCVYAAALLSLEIRYWLIMWHCGNMRRFHQTDQGNTEHSTVLLIWPSCNLTVEILQQRP